MDENFNQGMPAAKAPATKTVIGIIIAILVLAILAYVIYAYRSASSDQMQSQDDATLSDEEKSAILLKLSQEATSSAALSDGDKLKMLEALK